MTGNIAEKITETPKLELIEGGKVEKLVLGGIETTDPKVIEFLKSVDVEKTYRFFGYGEGSHVYKVEEKGLTTGGWPYFVPSFKGEKNRWGYVGVKGLAGTSPMEMIAYRPNDLPRVEEY